MKAKRRWEDHFSRQAKKDKYPARSVFKLQEIQKKHRLIKPGDKVLDLGCSPGSWLLYAATATGSSGKVIGIDLKPVTVSLPPHAKIYTDNELSLDEPFLKDLGTDFNAVISDMAPATSGIKSVDAVKSFNLCKAALSIATYCLLPGGCFLCKNFQGEDSKDFIELVRKNFDKQKNFKPKSSRKASKEIYIIGIGKK